MVVRRLKIEPDPAQNRRLNKGAQSSAAPQVTCGVSCGQCSAAHANRMNSKMINAWDSAAGPMRFGNVQSVILAGRLTRHRSASCRCHVPDLKSARILPTAPTRSRAVCLYLASKTRSMKHTSVILMKWWPFDYKALASILAFHPM
jgi:hypothetical protein